VLQLQLRLGILVRLFIEKGVIAAEEYAWLIAAGQPRQKTGPGSPGALPDTSYNPAFITSET
jgi:hypothetical protein